MKLRNPGRERMALIIVVCIAAVTTLGCNANSTFSFVGSAIKPAG